MQENNPFKIKAKDKKGDNPFIVGLKKKEKEFPAWLSRSQEQNGGLNSTKDDFIPGMPEVEEKSEEERKKKLTAQEHFDKFFEVTQPYTGHEKGRYEGSDEEFLRTEETGLPYRMDEYVKSRQISPEELNTMKIDEAKISEERLSYNDMEYNDITLAMIRDFEYKKQIYAREQYNAQFSTPEKYAKGFLKAINQGTADFFYALDNATVVLEDVLGEEGHKMLGENDHGFSKIAKWIEDETVKGLPDTPDTWMGNVLNGLGHLSKLYLELAITPQFKLAKVSMRLPMQLGADNFVNTYAELKKQDVEVSKQLRESFKQMGLGVKDGVLFTALGYGSGTLGRIVQRTSGSASLTGATTITANATGFGTLTAVEELINSGSVNMDNVWISVGMGAGLAAREFPGMFGHRAYANFNACSKETLRAVINSDLEASKLRKQAQDMYDKAYENKNKLEQDQYNTVGTVLDNIADIKAMSNMVMKDPAGFLKIVKNDSQLSAETKKMLTDRVNEGSVFIDPRYYKIKPHTERIKELESEKEYVEQNDKMDPVLKDIELREIKNRIKEEQDKLVEMITPKEKPVKEPVVTKPEKETLDKKVRTTEEKIETILSKEDIRYKDFEEVDKLEGELEKIKVDAETEMGKRTADIDKQIEELRSEREKLYKEKMDNKQLQEVAIKEEEINKKLLPLFKERQKIRESVYKEEIPEKPKEEKEKPAEEIAKEEIKAKPEKPEVEKEISKEELKKEPGVKKPIEKEPTKLPVGLTEKELPSPEGIMEKTVQEIQDPGELINKNYERIEKIQSELTGYRKELSDIKGRTKDKTQERKRIKQIIDKLSKEVFDLEVEIQDFQIKKYEQFEDYLGKYLKSRGVKLTDEELVDFATEVQILFYERPGIEHYWDYKIRDVVDKEIDYLIKSKKIKPEKEPIIEKPIEEKVEPVVEKEPITEKPKEEIKPPVEKPVEKEKIEVEKKRTPDGIIKEYESKIKEIDDKLKTLKANRVAKTKEIAVEKTEQKDLFPEEKPVEKEPSLIEVEKDFGKENIRKILSDVDDQIKKLEQERIRMEQERDKIKEEAGKQIEIPEKPKEKVIKEEEEIPEREKIGEHEDADWISKYSKDPDEVARAWKYETETNIPYENLEPWQQHILGDKVTEKSWNRFGDRNTLGKGVRKRWIDDKGTTIDKIHHEINTPDEYGHTLGKEVSESDIVEFMLDVVHKGAARRTTDLQRDLAKSYKNLTGKSIKHYDFSYKQPDITTKKEIFDKAVDILKRNKWEELTLKELPSKKEQYFREFPYTEREYGYVEEYLKSKGTGDLKVAEPRPGDFLRKLKSDQSKVYESTLGIPVAIWDGAIETAATAIDLGVSVAKAIKKGIREIQETKWYNNLKSKEKKETLDYYKQWIMQEYSNSKPITDEDARKKIFGRIDKREKGVTEIHKKFIKKVEYWGTKLLYDQTGNVKNALIKFPGGRRVVNEFNTRLGMSALSAMEITDAQRKIFGDIYSFMKPREQELLSEYIDLNRTVELDKMYDERGELRLIHEGDIELKHAEKFIELMKANDSEICNKFRIKKIDWEKYDKAAKEYYKVMHDNLYKLYKARIINKNAYDKLKEEQPFYSKRKYLEYVNIIDPAGRRNRGVLSGIAHLKEGSEGSKVISANILLADIITRTNSIIARNNACIELEKFISDNPDNKFAKQSKPSVKFLKRLKKLEEKIKETEMFEEEQEPVITEKKFIPTQFEKTPLGWTNIDYLVDGIPKRIIMLDELAEEWLFSGDPEILNMVKNILGWGSGTKVLKAAATGYNPEFGPKNIFLDVPYVLLTTNEYHLGKGDKLWQHSLPIGLVQIAGDMIGRVSADTFLRKGRYKKYIEQGGGMQFLTMQGQFGRKSKRYTKRSIEYEGVKEVAAYIGTSSEILTRLALQERYKSNRLQEYKREGKIPTPEEMKIIEKDATACARGYLDFNQGGFLVKLLDSFMPYLNPGVQVTRGIFRAAKRNPKVFWYKIGNLAAFSAGITAYNLGLSYFGDEKKKKERAEYYKNEISNQTKARNWVLMTNFNYKDVKGNKIFLHLKFPKDNSIQLVTGLFEGMTMMMAGEKNAVFNKQRGIELWSLFKNFSDISSMPPALGAWYGYKFNLDFFYDSKIWPGADQPIGDKSQEFIPGITPPFYRQFGKKTKLSPMRSEYAARQFLTRNNIFGDMLEKSLNISFGSEYVDKKFEKEFLQKFSEYPFIRRFVRGTSPYQRYAVIDEYERKENYIKTKNNHELDELMMNKSLNELFEKESDKKLSSFFESKDEFEFKRLIDRMIQKIIIKEEKIAGDVLTMKYAQPYARAEYFYETYKKLTPAKREKLVKESLMVGGILTGGKFKAKLRELDTENIIPLILKTD